MEAAHASIRRARPLLGTFVEIAVAGATISVMEAGVEAAFAAVATVHRLMSFQEATSDVERLNRGAWSGAIPVHGWTYQVLETALDLNRRSAGVFDVAVAPALQDVGLLPRGPNLSSASPSPRLPSGRLRSSPSKTGVNALSSATGYGEGRGEGAFPQAQTRGEAPPPPPPPPPPPNRGGGGGGGAYPRRGGGWGGGYPPPPPPYPPPQAGEGEGGGDLSPQAGRGEAVLPALASV